MKTQYHIGSVSDILALIGRGEPLALGMVLNQEFFNPVNGVITYSPLSIPNSGHAVLGVGIGKHQATGQDYLLIRNSWGPSWGDAGYVLSSAVARRKPCRGKPRCSVGLFLQRLGN